MKKVISLVALVTVVFTLGRAQTCDTLINLVYPNDTPVIIAASTDSGGGYLSGNNAFGDLAVAEAFAVPDTNVYLTLAALYFGVATISPNDTNNIVTIYAWDNLGASVFGGGAPLDPIDSVEVTLGQIALSVTEKKLLLVHFTSLTSLGYLDTIFIGLVLPVDTGGDTLALLTNTPNGSGGNGYVLALDPSGDGAYTWNTYNDNYQFGDSGSLGNYILAGFCGSPNPTPEDNFVPFSAQGCTPYTVNFNDITNTPPIAPTGWTWIFGDGNTANGSNATDIYTTPGLYAATELATCDTSSVVEVFVPTTSLITVLASPAVTATVTPSPDDTSDASAFVTVVSASGHYFTYWYDTTALVASGTDTLANVFNGVYVVEVSDQNGCTVYDSVFIEPLTTGIIKISASLGLNVYPNPATDVLNMVWSSAANAEVSVLDLNGNLISTLITNGATKTVYNIEGLASGAYILRITDKTTNQQQSRLFTKF